MLICFIHLHMETISVVEAGLCCEALQHASGCPGHGLLLRAERAVQVHLELLLEHLDDEVGVTELLAIELYVGDQSCLGMEFVSGEHVFIFYPCIKWNGQFQKFASWILLPEIRSQVSSFRANGEIVLTEGTR